MEKTFGNTNNVFPSVCSGFCFLPVSIWLHVSGTASGGMAHPLNCAVHVVVTSLHTCLLVSTGLQETFLMCSFFS